MESPSSERVSVIVPAYNAATTIGETLRSATQQTHTDLEILVADDGSTDDTPSIVRSIAESDTRVRLIEGPHCGHPGTVRNRALRQSTGGAIALLDADDLWVRSKIARQMRELKEDPGADFCATSARLLPADQQSPLLEEPATPEKATAGLRVPNSAGPSAYADLLTRNRTLHTSGILITRDLFDRTGPFSEDPELQSGQDDDFILRAWKRGRPVLVPEVYVYARCRPDSVSALNSWQNVFAILDAAERRGELPASIRNRAWSAAWLVRGERGMDSGNEPWRNAMFRSWWLDPLNPRRLPLPGLAILPRPFAQGLYGALRRRLSSAHSRDFTPRDNSNMGEAPTS